jgi:DNA (cytosine-5)-methyltransferase 1
MYTKKCPANEQLTVASLFSGAGGMDLGFVKAGFNIIWANDNDPDSVETYALNLGRYIILDDVETIDSNEIPDADIIIGGFPCQGFSVANVDRSSSDPRNKLYKNFARILADKKPKIFLAENVKGILSLEKGEVFRLILREFSSVGYNCQYALLNAADYGTPQIRERVFIVGIRKDLDSNIDFPPKATHSKYPDHTLKSWVSISEALSKIPDPDQNHSLNNHVCSKFKLKFNGYLSHRPVDPRKPSPTITARGDNKGGAVIIHHPNNERRLTCREAAYLQDFPLDFKFAGSMTSVYRQIGNAVPVSLAQSIAQVIKDYFEGHRRIPNNTIHQLELPI